MIQKQIWKDEIRILITNELYQGSVQISIPFYDSDILGKADALIYALYVDKNSRRHGVAKQLLDEAEKLAKLNRVNVIGIEYDKEESDRFVFEFYKKCGYKPFDENSNFLIKKL